MTKRGFCVTETRNRPSTGSVPVTSAYVRSVMFSWWAAAAIFGVQMQLAQSRVGKTFDRPIIFPPMLALFSTTTTENPWSARSSAAWSPAIPPPMTSASVFLVSLMAFRPPPPPSTLPGTRASE